MDNMTLYERRVRRLHDRVIANQKKSLEEQKKAVQEPTKNELMAMLDEKGIEYDKKATKAELMELLKEDSRELNSNEDAE